MTERNLVGWEIWEVQEIFYPEPWMLGDPEMRKPMSQDHIMQFFAYSHLPEHLQEISKPFCEMAEKLVETLPRNPERTVALRKLLEGKDAAVRALVAKD